MPYLNWKNRDVRKSIEPHADARSTLTLALSVEERAELLPFLEEVYLRGGSELRLDLPGEWIVFWKTRDSESRLLLAHPQHEEWVATVALDADHGHRLVERLSELQAGDALPVTELGAIGAVSNVEIILSLS